MSVTAGLLRKEAGMSYNPAQGFPRIMPSLRYEDLGKALAWLSQVFGLKEHLRWTDEQGIIRHAEMRLDTAFIELAQAPEGELSPHQLGQVWQSLVVLVDNVDAHYQHARTTGATIIAEIEDKPWGLRQYTALDLQGHRWEFSQHLSDVPPAEWGAQLME
jgi:uncharacterized glyoxalase superfamily protein PhnB